VTPGHTPEIVVADLDALTRKLVDDVSREAGDGLQRRDRFAMAVPGGSVARHALPALGTLSLDWTRSHVFWVDERAVPVADPDSNFGLAEAAWLLPAQVPRPSIHPMPTDGADLAASARQYEQELVRVLGDPPQLDYVLLGVGPDGHVASLFPGHGALLETHRAVVPIFGAPKPPARRLSLTLPILTGARRVVVMAFGESKSAAIREAVSIDQSVLPLALVLRRAARVLVLLDESAAAGLRRPGGR